MRRPHSAMRPPKISAKHLHRSPFVESPFLHGKPVARPLYVTEDGHSLLQDTHESCQPAGLVRRQRLPVEASPLKCLRRNHDGINVLAGSQNEVCYRLNRNSRAGHDLAPPGMNKLQIARQLALDRRTARRWIRSDGFPERKSRCRARFVESYVKYLK
jgi:hypothetical protein